jgi:hypothetical protein
MSIFFFLTFPIFLRIASESASQFDFTAQSVRIAPA